MSELDDARDEQRLAAQALYRLYTDKNSKNLRPMLREKLNPPDVPRSERPIRDLPLRSRLAYAIGRIVSLGRSGPDIRIEQQQAMLQQQALMQSQQVFHQMGLRPQEGAPQGPVPGGFPDPAQGQAMPGPAPAQLDPLAQIQAQLQALQERIEAISDRVSDVDWLASGHAAAKQKGDVFEDLANLGAAVRKERDRSIEVGDVPVAGEFIIAARKYQTELGMLQDEALRQQGIHPESPDVRSRLDEEPQAVEELLNQAGRPAGRSFGRRTLDAERVLLSAAMRNPGVRDGLNHLLPELSFSPQGANVLRALDLVRAQGGEVTPANLFAEQAKLAQSDGIPAEELYRPDDYDRLGSLSPTGIGVREAAGQVARDYQSALWDSHIQAQDELLARSEVPAEDPSQAPQPMSTVDKFAAQQRLAKSYVAMQERIGEQLETGQEAIRDAVNHSVGQGQGSRRKAAAMAGAALRAPASAPDGPAAAPQQPEQAVVGPAPRRAATGPKR